MAQLDEGFQGENGEMGATEAALIGAFDPLFVAQPATGLNPGVAEKLGIF